MKVLFILPETPDIGGGGIATYLKHARKALEKAGHDVFTFTWYFKENMKKMVPPSSDKDDILSISGRDVWEKFPRGPFQIALSYYLLPHICHRIEKIQPDVIETSDYQAPLYGFLAERRAGRLKKFQHIPVIGFNHGLQRNIYSSNGMLPTVIAQEEMAGERQMMRWCDLIIVPSQTARRVLEYQLGKTDHIKVIYEPFQWPLDQPPEYRKGNNFYHLGRLSFQKGIDHEVHFLNAVDPLMKIDQVYFLGKNEYTPFRINNAEEYIRSRIKPSLRERLIFLGNVSQNDFEKIFFSGGYSMNFSEQETFNYAAVEMISNGLFPFIMSKTPMEEFLPEEIRNDLLLPHDFNLDGLAKLIADVQLNSQVYYQAIISHLQTLTNPDTFAASYEKAVDHLKVQKQKIFSQSKLRYTNDDITVLMATYNNAHLIKESIESVRAQTLAPKELIILDDGSYDPGAIQTLNEYENDPKIKIVYSNRNEGLCASRMKLIHASKTTLSIFLDSDDLLAPDYLEKTLTAINESSVDPDAVLTWRQNFGLNNELIILDLMGDHFHLLKNDFRMTSLIRTDVLKEIGFLSSMRNGEADDWLFWLDFTAHGYKSVMVGEPLFLYRFAENSMSWPWSQGHAALTCRERSKRWIAIQNNLPPLAV